MTASVLDPPLIQPELIRHCLMVASMYISTGFLGVFITKWEEKTWKAVYAANYDRIWLTGMKITW
jgi:hypothetical protein